LANASGIGSHLRLRLLRSVGGIAYYQGDYVASRRAEEEALELARAGDDENALAITLDNLALTKMALGDFQGAAELFNEELAIARELGGLRLGAALLNLGYMHLSQGENAAAVGVLEEAVDVLDGVDVGAHAIALHNLGLARLAEGRAEEATRLFRRSLEGASNEGIAIGIHNLLLGLGAAAAREGQRERAASLVGAFDRVGEEIGWALEPYEARLREETLADLRQQLGEGAFERALAEGAAMTLDEAVAYALHDNGDARVDHA
jgi:tetratricopeptide (TPR) repeat protein